MKVIPEYARTPDTKLSECSLCGREMVGKSDKSYATTEYLRHGGKINGRPVCVDCLHTGTSGGGGGRRLGSSVREGDGIQGFDAAVRHYEEQS